jgi:ubiquitin-like 1-activating enzyme E1 A
MRSSTVLVLSLKSISHELIKNIVLAGIGRLIVMDDAVVTEEDLGGGFLFREEEGAVGQEVSWDLCVSDNAERQRVNAAAPQIASLNPLVSLTVLPTLAPFVRDQSAAAQLDDQQEMAAFLQREKVDVVIACDMTVQQMVSYSFSDRLQTG